MVLIAPQNKKYMPFQEEGIRFILGHPNTLLADEMGLGKTIQVIGAINNLKGTKRILVVCPASVKLMWRDRFYEWCTKYYDGHVIKGRSDVDNLKSKKPDIVVMNYAVAQYYKEYLASIPWSMKIYDECHYLTGMHAIRTKNLLKVWAERSLFLSGTPGEKPIDMYPMLRHLDKDSWGGYDSYVLRYCNPHMADNGYKQYLDVSGCSNSDEFCNKLKNTVMLRRLKKQVMPELPDKIKTVYPVDIGEDLRFEEINQLKGMSYADAVYKLSTDNIDFGENMASIRKQIGLAKVPYIVEKLINMSRAVKKVLCFAWHRDVIDEIVKRLGPERCVCVKGGLNTVKKEAALNTFACSEPHKFYIGQIAAMGTGTDGLQDVTDTAVFAEIDWSIKNMLQAEDRIHRRGQKNSCRYEYIVADGYLESYMAKKLLKKEKIYNSILDGGNV